MFLLRSFTGWIAHVFRVVTVHLSLFNEELARKLTRRHYMALGNRCDVHRRQNLYPPPSKGSTLYRFVNLVDMVAVNTRRITPV